MGGRYGRQFVVGGMKKWREERKTVVQLKPISNKFASSIVVTVNTTLTKMF